MIGRLVVVGLGLIGGSFAKGLRESGLCGEVVGVDLDPQSCKLAVELGVVDRCETDLALACQGADVIQLAVPILAMEKLLAVLAGMDLGQAILTDVGSAKGNVVRAAQQAFGEMPARFVPGHPIAGSEQSGVEASNAQLFRRHKVILTPLAQTDPALGRGRSSVARAGRGCRAYAGRAPRRSAGGDQSSAPSAGVRIGGFVGQTQRNSRFSAMPPVAFAISRGSPAATR